MILTAGRALGRVFCLRRFVSFINNVVNLQLIIFATLEIPIPEILTEFSSHLPVKCMTILMDFVIYKLTEGLRRKHSRNSQSDAFRVLLNDPLHAVETRKSKLWTPWRRAQHKPKLIIVDALDESKTDAKSDFLDLISEKFLQLPKYIKIFITSRPELQIGKQLQHLNPVEILPDNRHHNLDLEYFILHCLQNLSKGNVSFLISKYEDSFLYAHYVVDELKDINLGIEPNLSDYVPKGISGFYEKQFKRLRTGLQSFNPNTWSSILKRFVNVIAASRAPLPMKILVDQMHGCVQRGI